MSEPQPRIPGIRQQYCTVNDAEETTLVSSIATNLAYAEAWAVTRDGQARKIGRTTEGACGKIDAAGVCYFQDGTVRLWAAAADVGGGGATSHTVYFDFPGEVHPLPQTVTAEDRAARWQANAATNMAHTALKQNDVQTLHLDTLDVRVDTLDMRIGTLEQG